MLGHFREAGVGLGIVALAVVARRFRNQGSTAEARMNFKRWPVWSTVMILAILAWAAGSYACADGDGDTGADVTQSEEIDEVIRELVLASSDPVIEDVSITSKTAFTDSDGTTWLRFQVTPVPENVTDPAYGVIRKTSDEDWELVGLGTCCIEEDLPAEVREGLGF